MMDTKPLVGILQCGEKPEGLGPEFGDYDTLFHALLGTEAFRYRTWRALDGQLPDGPDAADAWLLTGSRYGAYEALDWIAPLEDFVREVHAQGVPMLGICFGHQLIAQALGGRVEKYAEGWSIGRVEYRFDTAGTELPAFEALPDHAVPLMAWHQDQVVEVPPGAQVIAASDVCRNAALLYGQTTFTVQPHPEFGPLFVQGLLDTRGKAVPAPLRDRAAATLDQPLAREAVAETMRRFVLQALERPDAPSTTAPCA